MNDLAKRHLKNFGVAFGIYLVVAVFTSWLWPQTFTFSWGTTLTLIGAAVFVLVCDVITGRRPN